MRRALMVLGPLVVLAAGGIGAWTMVNNRPVPATRLVEVEPPLVRVVEVRPQAVQLKVHAQGTVGPRTESGLAPEVSGRVVEVSPSLTPGGFFEEGDALLRIDAREYELEVVRARAAVAAAKLKLATEEQEAAVARQEWKSLGEGVPTPLVLHEPQIAEARASLAAAEAALAKAEYDLERTILRAPYAGRVRTEDVDVGQFVTRGLPIARIYSVDFAEVKLPVPDSELAYVDLPLAYRDGVRGPAAPNVTVRATFAGQPHEWTGRLVRTEGEIDPRSRMVQAIARIPDPYGRGGPRGRPPLAVGMFVEGEIQGKLARNVFALPRTALRGGDQVMVVDPENRLRFRAVEILRSEPERILVRSGLSSGERVCVSVLEAAVDGMEVRALEGGGA